MWFACMDSEGISGSKSIPKPDPGKIVTFDPCSTRPGKTANYSFIAWPQAPDLCNSHTHSQCAYVDRNSVQYTASDAHKPLSLIEYIEYLLYFMLHCVSYEASRTFPAWHKWWESLWSDCFLSALPGCDTQLCNGCQKARYTWCWGKPALCLLCYLSAFMCFCYLVFNWLSLLVKHLFIIVCYQIWFSSQNVHWLSQILLDFLNCPACNAIGYWTQTFVSI